MGWSAHRNVGAGRERSHEDSHHWTCKFFSSRSYGPGDISSAAFLVAAAALLPESDLEIDDVGLNPTRTQFLLTLRALGVQVESTEHRENCNEPVGTVRVKGSKANLDSDGKIQLSRGAVDTAVD